MFDILRTIRRNGLLDRDLPEPEAGAAPLDQLQRQLQTVFGRALRIRQVDAGSCNGCELEIQALSNPYYNLEGSGIAFVASPRHADVLLVTGPVSVNMEQALRLTYAAMPEPKWVLATGDCAACGGVFGTGYATRGPVSSIIPVDAVVTGCPPTPLAIMQGLLRITAQRPA